MCGRNELPDASLDSDPVNVLITTASGARHARTVCR